MRCSKSFSIKSQSKSSSINSKFDSCYNFASVKISKVLKIITQEDKESDVDLREYGLDPSQFWMMFKTLTDANLQNLNTIKLKNNDLDCICCLSLESYIKKSKTLKEINFERCIMNIEGAKRFSKGINDSSSISCLKLRNCELDDNIGSVLIEALIFNKSCEDIDFSMNAMSVSCSKNLEKLFMKNKATKKINLSNNLFNTDKCYVNIFKGLGFNDYITQIDLSWNGLSGLELGKIFIKSLKKCKIESLNLEHNLMSTIELKKLALALRKSKTIEKIYIGDNLISDGLDEILVKVFKVKENVLKYISFGKWHNISKQALQTYNEIRVKKPDIIIAYRE